MLYFFLIILCFVLIIFGTLKYWAVKDMRTALSMAQEERLKRQDERASEARMLVQYQNRRS